MILMDLILDESIPIQIEKALEKKGVVTRRPETGKEDFEVMGRAIQEDTPILTRDQGDFVKLNQELDHPGILMDKKMHLRENTDLVAETISRMLKEISEGNLENSVWYLSDYYGR